LLLLETRQVLQGLPEAQADTLLAALLRGGAPVARAARSRLQRALSELVDMPSQTLARGDRGLKGEEEEGEEEEGEEEDDEVLLEVCRTCSRAAPLSMMDDMIGGAVRRLSYPHTANSI
jgi:hypothetical protein